MWEHYGLKKNPYDILPLIEGGDLQITEAFVGRTQEKKYINTLFASEERVCITICGDVGIGKTSLANYEKVLWKYTEKQKPLFSFRREIEANEAILDKRNFLLEIIGSILREIELLEPSLLSRHDLLKRLHHMVDITQTLGLSGSVSAGMFGFGIQSNLAEKEIQKPFQITTSALEKQFTQLLAFILTHKIAKKQYKGLIIHVNNFELAMTTNKKKVLQFFGEIRDLLQTPHLYFMFLGPTNFFKDIISKEARVKGVFNQTPIILAPLSKKELVQTINKRLDLLKSPTAKKFIKPFDDSVIFELYDMFNGDIRLIMSSLKDIVAFLSDKLPKTVTLDEAMVLLGKERLSHIETKLTTEQMKILVYIATHETFVTQNEIARKLDKSPTNVSNYYFRPLIAHDIIEVKKVSGRNKYWGLTEKYLPLKKIFQSQKNLTKHLTALAKRGDLFKA